MKQHIIKQIEFEIEKGWLLLVFAHLTSHNQCGLPCWITAHGHYPILLCKLVKFSD